ncbi:MAG: hypothetical protein AzoDbin1_04085 [Azoarcus sp.]|nr:hypothetical protein [Azoarcus sp.]
MSKQPVSIETMKANLSSDVVLKLGGVRIQVSSETYQEMLRAAEVDLAELHSVAVARERNALERVKKSYEAVEELRAILYEREGDYFLLRGKPDDALLEAFLEKYARLMGFE